MSWSPIQSHPKLLTQLLENLQVKGLRVEELYSLDLEYLHQFRPLYALTLLYKWRPPDHNTSVVDLGDYNPNLFFASQVINKASVTQAVISLVMNCPHVDIGPYLSNLKDFTQDFPPLLKGLAIANYEPLRNIHNTIATSNKEEETAPASDDGILHFINFVVVDNTVYELDGHKECPTRLGKFHGNQESLEWIKIVKPVIQKHIEKFSKIEVNYSLLAIIINRKDTYTEHFKDPLAKQDFILKQLVGDTDDQLMDLDAESKGLYMSLVDTSSEVDTLKNVSSLEDMRIDNWRVENIRRKHNYTPFLFNFLKVLAKRDQLRPLLENLPLKNPKVAPRRWT